MSTQRTVVEQKQIFLQSRKQLLSRGIVPSEKLKIIAHDGGVELSVLKGALDKVNRDLKQHSRRVYSRQMVEHVVEQIDKLYWTAGERQVDDEDSNTVNDIEDNSKVLHHGDDLTQDENISKLPQVWDTSADPAFSRNAEVNQDDYLAAMSRLQDLSAQRLTLQQKLNTYRTLLSLLEPYRKPKDNIQPNLVSKDSPLASELMKTRTLAFRVMGRVGEKFGDAEVSTATEEDEIVEMTGMNDEGRKKLNQILAGW